MRTMTPANLAPAPSFCLALALSFAGAGCSTADGLGTNSDTDPPPDYSGGGNDSFSDPPHPGLDDGEGDGDDGDVPEEYDCVTHRWRGYAYPIYANDELEVVSPGAGEPHSGVCVGTEDVSEDEHWAIATVCGPRLGQFDYDPDDPVVAAMLESARLNCEAHLFENFELVWPELEQQYEHWLGPDQDTAIFTLSRVACVPLQAENPWADYAAGSCAGYDDPALAPIEPWFNEDFDSWYSCHEDIIGECVPPVVIEGALPEPDDAGEGAPAQVDLCETYRRHVASDITVVVEGRRIVATMNPEMVDALLSLRFATCEYDRYDGTRFASVDDWSIFAAVGLRDGDRPVRVQALAGGMPTGRVYPLGRAGQELDAFAGLFADGRPAAIRVELVRGGITDRKSVV